MKTTERFSNRVADYINYRPHYPAQIIPFLKSEIGLIPEWKIADIGSGTGISSELFLQNGNTIFGIEPNKEMREAAENISKNEKNFISVNATAEETSLPPGNIDLIVAGQAFHWFDREKAKDEFKRILAAEGYVLLLWNERQVNSAFQKEYEEMLHQFCPNYAEVNHRNTDAESLAAFFAPFGCKVKAMPNQQQFNFEGLKGRLLSSSYAPIAGHPKHQPMIQRLQQIFRQYQMSGLVTFDYQCRLYYGQLVL
jgi:ubiquinone/menaquinone biosynthesis C-methylase UbiE